MGSESHKLHVLFFPFMAPGHMIPMVDIARLFALRGAKSTILTTPTNASNISSKITRCQNSGLDIDILTIPFPSEEARLPKGCESADALVPRSPEMTMKFFEAVGLLQPKFQQVIEQMHPDCIVSDMFLPWTTDIAKHHGIPRLIFHGTSFFALCVSTTTLRNMAPQESDEEVFVVPGLPDKVTMKKSQLPTHFGPKNKFSEMMERIRETEMTSYGVLMNSFYELEPAYADHYRKVVGRRSWHIGPVSLSNNNTIDKVERGRNATIDEHYCLDWLNSKEPNSVIYVSFGSVARFGSAQLMEIAEGLEASGVSFVWVVRRTTNTEDGEKFLPEGFEERMEGKGLIIRDWAPQVLILDHPAIGGFLTHCGWNSILEGVSAGVPLITWPLFAEQFQNEILITDVLKIGIKVGVEKWQPPSEEASVLVKKEKMEEVVSRLMKSEEGEEMRKKAKELKEMAKRAVEEGGSSYSDLSALIEDLRQHVVSKTVKE